MPARVEKKVAMSMGINISVGCAAPICALYTIMLTGIKVSPEVLSTKNMIMEFDAVSFFAFSSCKPSIAFKPKGVAALSKPSMLAAMFIKMLPYTGCPLGNSGNNLLNTGLSTRAMAFTTPPFSPIFITPSQSESTPVKPNDISKAVFDEAKVESIIAGNTATSPINTSFTNAMTKAIAKKAIQM